MEAYDIREGDFLEITPVEYGTIIMRKRQPARGDDR
jgi:bifunctional DNA-binding transcriptional regulator/antitoxin component of YhaV-PrlF toxin-antitoxin module